MVGYFCGGQAWRERHVVDRQNHIATLKVGVAGETGESIYYDDARLALHRRLIGADGAVGDTDCALSFVAVFSAYHLSDRVVSGDIQQPVILFGKLGAGVELGDLIQVKLIGISSREWWRARIQLPLVSWSGVTSLRLEISCVSSRATIRWPMTFRRTALFMPGTRYTRTQAADRLLVGC